MLGEVVVDDEGVLALLHEVLAHRATGIGRQVLKGGGLRGCGGDHDGVVHGSVLLQRGHDPGHLGPLLTNGNVDTGQVTVLLVDDGVEGQGCLSGLTIPNDELPLAPTDGDHRVDGLDPSLDRCVHALPHCNVGGDPLHGAGRAGLDRPFAVHRLAEGVDDTADQRFSYRN